MITYPTVNRAVHFYPESRDGGPLAAIIAHVFDARCVNLAIFSPEGEPVLHPPQRILLVHEGDEVPTKGRYCCWPPRVEAGREPIKERL